MTAEKGTGNIFILLAMVRSQNSDANQSQGIILAGGPQITYMDDFCLIIDLD